MDDVEIGGFFVFNFHKVVWQHVYDKVEIFIRDTQAILYQI